PAQALADLATIAVLQQRTLAHSQLERGQLQFALNSRIVLEQVKGLLAERWHLSVDEAFAAFRIYARSHHHQLGRLAHQIADGDFDTDLTPRPAAPPHH
ncbi:ANTAR domain-containing protein, partial [Kitasatospora nipponensis]|uniref:ANTAR domain-containing protein n=1 Tax=Kitasatospora nipponensis TaxID=258049 RepID=UPI0031D7E860